MKRVLFFILMVVSSLACADEAPLGSGTVEKSTQAPDRYFLKAAGGLFLIQYFDNNYFDRPVANGIPQEVITLLNTPQDFTASLAAGVNCPDHFSFFVSLEWMTRDWGTLVNAQYTPPNFDLIKPYLYLGVGLDFNQQSSVGPGGQAGAGLEYDLAKNLSLFSEVKAYVAFGFASDSYSYRWYDFYFPVLAGVKYNL